MTNHVAAPVNQPVLSLALSSAVGVAIGAAARAHLPPVGVGPGRVSERGHRPLLGNDAELAVAGLAELDNPLLATRLGDGAGAGQRLDTGRAGKARPVVTEFGQQRRGEQLTGSR